jgi:hypothetical protein
MFAARLPLTLRRCDDDDDDWCPPEPKPSLHNELAKLIATTLVTASVAKVVDHFYERWTEKRKDD